MLKFLLLVDFLTFAGRFSNFLFNGCRRKARHAAINASLGFPLGTTRAMPPDSLPGGPSARSALIFSASGACPGGNIARRCGLRLEAHLPRL
jgi:hypothetical protein